MSETVAEGQAPAKPEGTTEKPAGTPAPKADDKPTGTPKADDKPAEKTTDGGDAAKDKPAAKAAGDAGTTTPPVKYTLAVPKGAEGYIDTSDLKALEKDAREAGLTNEQAQAAVDRYADTMAAKSKEFREETAANDVWGGDKLADTERLATSVMDRFAPTGDPLNDRLRMHLAKSGLGNELSVVSFLARIGKAMAEDRPAGGSGGGGKQEVDAATKLYGAEKSAAS
jgi:hypothetical protein